MPYNPCMLKSCDESFCERFSTHPKMFRMPGDTVSKTKWQRVLNGHECTQSEWLCIKHFDPNDLSHSNGQIVLRDGAVPDPNRMSTNTNSTCNTLNPSKIDSLECKNCDFLQNEVQDLKNQMAEIEREHDLKLAQERENFCKISKEKRSLVDKIRLYKAKLKQFTQLANEVTSDLLDEDDDYTRDDLVNEVTATGVMDDDNKNLIIAEIVSAIQAADPLTINNNPGGIENAASLSMESANGIPLNYEILANGIKCEFNEEDDPFGGLVTADGSFVENTIPDMETTSTTTLDEIVDPNTSNGDMKCAIKPMTSLAFRKALIERQLNVRKRQRNVHLWKRNRNRLARQSGSAYITKRNVPVPAKRPNLTDPLCYEKCRRNCSAKLTMEQRQAMFSAYYSLDLTGKNYFLFNCMQRKDVRFHRKNTKTQKLNTFSYSIKVPEQIEPIVLCKKALCSLLQITSKRMEIIQKKHLAGEVIEMNDGRGKHTNRSTKTPQQVFSEMFNHMNEYGMEYTSNDNDDDTQNGKSKRKRRKKRTPTTFTIKKMYDHYIERCKSKGLSDEYLVKYTLYANHFASKYNNI